MDDLFLPVNMAHMAVRGWERPDFVFVSGDAYVDHPSFGHAVISRLLESRGYKVAMLPQPDWRSKDAFEAFGRPRLGFLVSAGVIDSMVNHYTVSKKKRGEDAYAPGGRAGLRPDRATIVYVNRIREAYKDVPVIIGGLEASLRRFAHYDYWDDAVRNSILVDSGADILVYGMGERAMLDAAGHLASGNPISQFSAPGTCTMRPEAPDGYLEVESSETVARDKAAYARAFSVEYNEQDPVRGRGICQRHGKRILCQHPPAMPLKARELDEVYALPYARASHPMYDENGGVPALEEVKFSIASSRGCFGACNFCALTFHQGRMVAARSKQSILAEAKKFVRDPGFKGYIHDVGGPTANFRHPACKKQLKSGACKDKQCLYPKPCKNLDANQDEYFDILRELRALPGVKKVFVRSGIRYDYLTLDKNGAHLNELIRHHVSGQLKIAPEHVSDRVLRAMGKPGKEVYESFAYKYRRENEKAGMKQYLVPYFMSSHPGSTLEDAVELALFMKENRLRPEQVQDFYPTPGTLSTTMFYTGIDPRTMKKIFVPRSPEEKAGQRSLLQAYKPENRGAVIKALKQAGREELIGFSKDCLIAPREISRVPSKKKPPGDKRATGKKAERRIDKGGRKKAK